MAMRFISFIFGLLLITSVAAFGFFAQGLPSFVILFGLASAILIPLGFAAIGFSLNAGSRLVTSKLAKVPEIDRLIAEAESQEERVKLLRVQRKRLLDVLEFETKLHALQARRNLLESNATNLLQELNGLDSQIATLDEQVAQSPLHGEVKQLQQRVMARHQRDIVLNAFGKQIVISREDISSVPFLAAYIDVIDDLNGLAQRIVRRLKS